MFMGFTTTVTYMFCIQAGVRLSVTFGPMPRLRVSFEIRHYT